MPHPAARPFETRKADTLHRLATDIDAWVSTASPTGTPYLMPLSFLWIDETILLATARNNPTSRNIQATGQAHVAVGETRDVILLTGTAELVDDLPTDQAEAFTAKAGFDPRAANYPFIRVTPTKIQAWREVNELKTRDLMLNGTWLTP
jgi:general stress protein 26